MWPSNGLSVLLPEFTWLVARVAQKTPALAAAAPSLLGRKRGGETNQEVFDQSGHAVDALLDTFPRDADTGIPLDAPAKLGHGIAIACQITINPHFRTWLE